MFQLHGAGVVVVGFACSTPEAGWDGVDAPKIIISGVLSAGIGGGAGGIQVAGTTGLMFLSPGVWLGVGGIKFARRAGLVFVTPGVWVGVGGRALKGT